MSEHPLQLDKQDHVAIVTLDRPEKLNALSGALQTALHEAISEVRDDDNVRVAIITGAGRGFCSGADLTGRGEQKTPTQNDHLDDLGWVGRQAKAVYGLNKPVIGAINGVAAGAGMSLALACDMRVGSEKSRFKTVFIERNLSPDSGMSFFLPRIVGYSRAADLIYTSRAVDGEEAKIAFNSKYLQDVLQVLGGGQLALESTGPSNPGVFRPVGRENYVHVIMPMFVQW